MSAVLVLHGITMSGPSILQHLGPIGDAIRAQGLELIAPTAARKIGDAEMQGLLSWLSGAYEKRGQRAHEVFSKGVFWEAPGEHYDWFGAETIDDKGTGEEKEKKKHYAALEAGLDSIRAATEGRDIVGIVGFSQGCAMAALTAGLAKHGHLPFGQSLRFGIFLSGFKAVFDLPQVDAWPVDDLSALLTWGREDPVFPNEETIQTLAAEFTDPEVHLIDSLSHVVPHDPRWVQRIADFIRTHTAPTSAR